jgi:hypothetical protein
MCAAPAGSATDRHRLPALFGDLVDHACCGPFVKIIDNDARTDPGELDRVEPAESTAGARDDHNLIVESDVAHAERDYGSRKRKGCGSQRWISRPSSINVRMFEVPPRARMTTCGLVASAGIGSTSPQWEHT